jgi:hypothetical protein
MIKFINFLTIHLHRWYKKDRDPDFSYAQLLTSLIVGFYIYIIYFIVSHNSNYLPKVVNFNRLYGFLFLLPIYLAIKFFGITHTEFETFEYSEDDIFKAKIVTWISIGVLILFLVIRAIQGE